MSTGPRTQATFIQGNPSTTEHDASRSALFYLCQEVSKLASPIHNSFLDTNTPSLWLNDTSLQDAFVVKKEDEDAHSFQVSSSSCQQSLSRMLPYNQARTLKEDSHSSKATTSVEPQCESASPWKVLSLINLQCERLLHHSDVEEPLLGQSVYKASTERADITDQGFGGDCVSVECTLRPSLRVCERRGVPNRGSPVDDVRGRSGGACSYKRGVKSLKAGRCALPQTAEKTDAVGAELVEENATDEGEDEPSVHRQLERNQERKKDILNVPLSQNGTHVPDPSPNDEFDSDDDANRSKPALTLDHNGNLTESPRDARLPRPSAVRPSSQSASFCAAGSCRSLSKQTHKIAAPKPECTEAPIEGQTPPAARLNSSGCNGETNPSQPELRAVLKEEIPPPTSQQWRTKTPRKQPRPSRSVDIQDPDFQGVTFRMDTELDDSREQCRLLITSKYSKELCKSVRRPRLRTRTSQKSLKTSSSDEESDLTTNVSKGKVCASCCTRKTPMWRDAEDGTPLCNACGIRYKKYRVRCVNCWHIPRKEGNSNSCCLKCGNFVRLTSAQRKHTT